MRVRAQLAAAALRMFSERGFAEATVEEIAAAAGVSRRTFFRYFPTKQHAFFADHLERLAWFRGAAAARPGQTSWEAVIGALEELAAQYQADAARARAHHAVLVASDELRKEDLRLDEEWEREMREALVRAGDEPMLARVRAGALMGVTRAVLAAWFDDEGADLREVAAAALGRLGRGLGDRA